MDTKKGDNISKDQWVIINRGEMREVEKFWVGLSAMWE